MALLPVLLSVMGPSPYLSAQLDSAAPLTNSTLKVSNSAADNGGFHLEDSKNTVNKQIILRAPVVQRPVRVLRRHELVWNPYYVDYEFVYMPRTTAVHSASKPSYGRNLVPFPRLYDCSDREPMDRRYRNHYYY